MKRSLPQTLSSLALVAGATLATSAQAMVVLPSCPAMKTGTYVALNPLDPDPAWRVNVLSVNGDTLTVTDREGSNQLTATPTLCQFTLPNGGPLVMSKKSTFLARGVDDTGAVFTVFGMPLKRVALSSLAGEWNFFRRAASDIVTGAATSNGILTISSTGVVSAKGCDAQGLNCSSGVTLGRLRANTTEGGFTLTETSGGFVTRLFALQTAAGDKVMVGVGLNEAAFTVLAPLTPRTLPTVGARHAQWELTHSWNGTVSDINVSTLKVRSVDEATQTVRRLRAEDCRVDSWVYNSGRAGLAYRAPGRYKDCSGASLTYGANLSLSMREAFGFGVFGYEPSNGKGFFGIAIDKP